MRGLGSNPNGVEQILAHRIGCQRAFVLPPCPAEWLPTNQTRIAHAQNLSTPVNAPFFVFHIFQQMATRFKMSTSSQTDEPKGDDVTAPRFELLSRNGPTPERCGMAGGACLGSRGDRGRPSLTTRRVADTFSSRNKFGCRTLLFRRRASLMRHGAVVQADRQSTVGTAEIRRRHKR